MHILSLESKLGHINNTHNLNIYLKRGSRTRDKLRIHLLNRLNYVTLPLHGFCYENKRDIATYNNKNPNKVYISFRKEL